MSPTEETSSPSQESPSPSAETSAPTEETSAPTAAAPSPATTTPSVSAEAGPLIDKPVDDANDLRGYYFKQMMRRRLTWGITLGLMLAAGVAAAIFVGAAVGGGAAVAVLVLSILVVLLIADSKSADSFFETYCAQRGLTLGGRAPFPEATPLLSKGTDRYAERTMSGSIAEGVDGTLALYTYETESTDSKGNRHTEYHRFTVALVPIPECSKFVPELYCQQKFGFKALEKFEDVFRGDKERVRLESEALDDRYEIFATKEQDANWLRQLFSPTFIVWLTDESPRRFAFELVDGSLCCYVHGHKDKAKELDMVSQAAGKVGARLREESAE